MKKLIALLLALVMCLGLAACGGGNANSTASNSTPTPAPSQEPTPEPEPENEPEESCIYLQTPITMGDFEITVNQTYFSSQWNPNGDYARACSKGNAYFIFLFSIKNLG